MLIAFVIFRRGNSKKPNMDWAALEQYQAKNKALQLTDNRGDRIVFMGNSITEYWSQHHPEFFEGKPYVNRGISGQTTPQMLLRFRQDVVDLDPKIVVLLAGTNDIAGNTGEMTLQEIVANIRSMLEIAQANHIMPILCSVLPAADYPWKPNKRPAEEIPALNELLITLAEEYGIPYLDYFSAMTDGKNGLQKSYTHDGVHPNAKGYKVMGPLAEIAIQKVSTP